MIEIDTSGTIEAIDITSKVEKTLQEDGIDSGIVLVFPCILPQD